MPADAAHGGPKRAFRPQWAAVHVALFLAEALLAAALGVSRQTVNALETGRYDPSLPLAFKIARVFGQPIEAIFTED